MVKEKNMKKIILFLQLIISIGMSAQTTVESVQVADMDEGAPICGKSIDLHKRILQAYNCDSTLIVFACDTTKKEKYRYWLSLFTRCQYPGRAMAKVAETFFVKTLWRLFQGSAAFLHSEKYRQVTLDLV